MKRTSLKRKTPLRRMSKRRQSEHKEYMKLREQFLFMHPICQLWCEQNDWRDNGDGTYTDEAFWLVAGGNASANELMQVYGAPRSTEIHHRCCGKNRKATYLRTDTWWALCEESHRFIHDEPKRAYENGWLLKTIPEEPK